MTRRERKEGRLERRQAWAERRAAQASSSFGAAHAALDGIPPGQPILVGHHSEKRHRRTLRRADAAMSKGLEHAAMAKRHTSVAGGIARQLDTSVFSDDVDACERLEARIAERRAELERRKAINASLRKSGGSFVSIVPPLTDAERRDLLMVAQHQGHVGYPPYSISNLGATIRKDQKRLEALRSVAEQRARVRAVLEAERAAE